MIAGSTAQPARGVSPPSSSVGFFANDPNNYDYGLQLEIPSGFGDGEVAGAGGHWAASFRYRGTLSQVARVRMGLYKVSDGAR